MRTILRHRRPSAGLTAPPVFGVTFAGRLARVLPFAFFLWMGAPWGTFLSVASADELPSQVDSDGRFDNATPEAADSENVWQFGPMLALGLSTPHVGTAEERAYVVGGGLLADRSLINNRLELGLSVRLTGGTEALTVTTDFLVEVPYHLTPLFELYAGLGGSFAIDIHAQVGGGPIVAAGFHGWLNHHFGFGFEASYGYLFLSHGPNRHEFSLLVGPMWEFP